MKELEDALGALMQDPELMQKVQGLAQSLAQSQTASHAQETPDLSQLRGILTGNGPDPNQQALLQALIPYLSSGRVRKLERAMQAARMAGTASRFLSSGGLQMLTGR